MFAAALVARGRFRRELGSHRQWLLGIAAHKIADVERRRAVERNAQRRLGIERIAWTDDDRERVAALADAGGADTLLDELSGEQRTVVRAYVIEERSCAEIARTAGISEAAVRKRVSRGLGLLRTRLSREHVG